MPPPPPRAGAPAPSAPRHGGGAPAAGDPLLIGRSDLADNPLVTDEAVRRTLDAAARRAADRLGLPVGLVTVLVAGRQVVAGAHGLGPGLPGEQAAGWVFCGNAARRSGPFISGDLATDPRVALDPALRPEGVRALIAVPLPAGPGRRAEPPLVGSLAVAGPRPRRVTDDAVDALRALAELTVLELRRDHGIV